MANRNTRPVGFQGVNLANAARVNTQLPAVERSGGSDQEMVAKQADILGDRIGRMADDAMAVEATRAGKLAAADGTFRPTNGTSIRDQNFDKAGGDLYFSKLNAQFESDAQTLFERHKDDPAGWQQNFQKLKADYQDKHVFPEFSAAFDARATRLDTSYRATALDGFQKRQKDERLASFVGDMRSSETARTRMLALDPNAPDIEQNVADMVAGQELRIQALLDAKDISAVKAEEMKAMARSEARVQVISARAAKLGSDEEISQFRADLKKQFAEGGLKGLDGESWQKLDAGLEKIGKAKRIETDRAEGALKAKIGDYLDRQSKGLQPSVTEMTALAVEAEKLGPRGAVLVDEARQKLQLRNLIETLPDDKAERLVAGLKQEAAAGPARLLRPFVAPGLAPENVDQLDSAVAGPLAKMLQAMPAELKGQVLINSGFRSNEKQAELYANRARNPFPVAAPGASTHNSGMAADLKFGSDAARQWVNDNAASFGLHFPHANDPIHIEPIDKAAKGRGGGLSKYSAGVIEDAEAALKDRRKRLDTDQLGEAERSQTIAQVSPLDWQAGDMLKGQIKDRIAQAEAVARANDRAPQYLRPQEKDRLREAVQAGGDKALGLVEQIVEGAGPRAPALLKEIESAAPRMAMMGVMLSRGNAYQREAARDAFEAMRMEQQPGAKITEAPKTARAIEHEEFGPAFGDAIADKQRAVDAARLVYRGRMAKFGYEPDSAEAEKLYRESLQIAMGRDGKETSTATGGVADYKPAGFFFGAGKVAVPERVIGRFLPDVFGAINDADLKEHPGGAPKAADGTDFTAAIFRRAYPVAVPGGFTFQVQPPGSDNPQFLRGANGKPFVLDWSWYEPRARSRVPQAFR